MILFAACNESKTEKEQEKDEQTVMICRGSRAYAYHSRNCRGLSNCRSEISNVSISRAKQMGYSPCKNCY